MNKLRTAYRISTFILRVIRRVGSEEQGTTIVYTSLALVGLLGFAALAIDGGGAFMQNRQSQNAADAAARELALGHNQSDAQNQADTFTVNNGSQLNDIQFNGNTVSVEAGQQFQPYFSGVLDWARINENGGGSPVYSNLSVSATAGAVFEPVTGTDNLPPFTVDCNCITYGTQVVLPQTHNYCVDDVIEYWNGESFSIWLGALDIGYSGGANIPERYFRMEPGTGYLTEASDGTAQIVGTVRNLHGDGFTIDFVLTGVVHFRRTIRFTFLQREKMFIFSTLSHAPAG
ncbi:hypothetical protein KFU94_15590 [Chloroflexi bacterium TSY]|nr:hypothetical protein [Chloroflexi bacterium TSY]